MDGQAVPPPVLEYTHGIEYLIYISVIILVALFDDVTACVRTCYNCAKIDSRKCRCVCANGWYGPDCSGTLPTYV